jgi:hypothetical protein
MFLLLQDGILRLDQIWREIPATLAPCSGPEVKEAWLEDLASQHLRHRTDSNAIRPDTAIDMLKQDEERLMISSNPADA